MHGSSSVPQEEVQRINAAGGALDPSARGVDENEFAKAVPLGVTKVNIDTDGRLVWTRVHREFFRDTAGKVRLSRAGQDLYGRVCQLYRPQERQAGQRWPPGRSAGRTELTWLDRPWRLAWLQVDCADATGG